MNFSEVVTVIGLFVICLLLISMGRLSTTEGHTYKRGIESNKSVVECEKSLARDQHCVPVYGAKVFEE